MARLPRLCLPGLVHHVILRGNNRQPIVLDDTDRSALLAHLAAAADAHQVALHAYVLMDDHLHLLLTPPDATALPRTVQALGRAYVRQFNRRHGRTGTLWEGRYRSTVIEADTWLLPCMAHLDWHPVQAGLVAEPADYRWSSHRHWRGLQSERMLTPHAIWWALGNTPFAREAAYDARVQAGLSSAERQALAASALHGWALGSPAFLAQLQAHSPRRLQRARPGRPRRAAAEAAEAPTPPADGVMATPPQA